VDSIHLPSGEAPSRRKVRSPHGHPPRTTPRGSGVWSSLFAACPARRTARRLTQHPKVKNDDVQRPGRSKPPLAPRHHLTWLEVVSITGPIPLAPNDVKGFFTLFPKCFSSFVHTTCSLSDLVQYLAFGEVHLRIATAFSNCRTLGNRTHPCGNAVRDGRYGAVTLHGITFQ
jgi:hypothetical protein